MKVIIAINSRGTGTPKASKAKTSLGFGHGSTVVMRTVMYDTRKQEKMNVSESKKIHIIALPQGTPLKVVTSEDQSWVNVRAILCWLLVTSDI